MPYPILEPDRQISFYHRLQDLKRLYLYEAMADTVSKIDIEKLDKQLAKYISPDALKQVASFGLRGEIFFPVPYIIETNPYLLGYYRLLFGISGKNFYDQGPFKTFRRLESSGKMPDDLKDKINSLCKSLAGTAELLIDGIDDLSLPIVRDLQILTLGPSLRGGVNTQIGVEATKIVFDAVRKIIVSYIQSETKKSFSLINDSGREVLIKFSNDPDISITSILDTGVRPLVSVEIKGGTDKSNAYNRLGEAEKSHQSAKIRGFFEFWTLIRVDVDSKKCKEKSPTTTHFFHIDRINDPGSDEHALFKNLLGSMIGIKV